MTLSPYLLAGAGGGVASPEWKEELLKREVREKQKAEAEKKASK